MPQIIRKIRAAITRPERALDGPCPLEVSRSVIHICHRPPVRECRGGRCVRTL